MKERTPQAATNPAKQPWRSPQLRFIGRIGDLVQHGLGKTLILSGDPGEPKKNRQHG